jgi:ribosomal protein L11 methylase PrmA
MVSSAARPAVGALAAEPGSFRDPSGRVIERDGRVLRVIADRAAGDYAWVRDHELIDQFVRAGRLVATRELDPAQEGLAEPGVRYLLEHERIPFISYPYEWPFAALQAAALLHLDFHLELLEQNATLIDASAYNVQFRGPRPVFIDVLSLRRYRAGEAWYGHRQFSEQFLNPLLLQALHGIAFNGWYRGAMEGVATPDLARTLRWRDRISWRVMTHVTGPAVLQRMAQSGRVKARTPARTQLLPKASLVALLKGLRTWIAGLHPHRDTAAPWAAYTTTHTYSSEEADAKRRFVAEFVEATKPATVIDVGCNTGDYAAVALSAGAQSVIGLEADPMTADKAFRRAAAGAMPFLPLVMDAADPSPSRGWREAERRSLSQRARFDGVIALAFVHHLAVARNVPLDQVVGWLTGLAPCGVVEFVQKDDPTVQQMLALREDVFDDYSLRDFTSLLARHARIVRQEPVSAAGRVLFWYEHGRR